MQIPAELTQSTRVGCLRLNVRVLSAECGFALSVAHSTMHSNFRHHQQSSIHSYSYHHNSRDWMTQVVVRFRLCTSARSRARGLAVSTVHAAQRAAAVSSVRPSQWDRYLNESLPIILARFPLARVTRVSHLFWSSSLYLASPIFSLALRRRCHRSSAPNSRMISIDHERQCVQWTCPLVENDLQLLQARKLVASVHV